MIEQWQHRFKLWLLKTLFKDDAVLVNVRFQNVHVAAAPGRTVYEVTNRLCHSNCQDDHGCAVMVWSEPAQHIVSIGRIRTGPPTPSDIN